VATFQSDKAQNTSKYLFGFGYGSDMNGLAQQPGPSNQAPIHYPFQSYDGKVTFTPEVWGQRTFNLNTDGLANYGMYADWLQSVQQAGGRAVVSDMMHGAESYLEMWERASGVAGESCRSARGVLRPAGRRRLRLGVGFQKVLLALGQPASRAGRSYRYCVARGRGRTLSAVFTSKARVGLWATNARGWAAGGVKPGQRARRLRGHARSIGGGVWLSRRLRGGNRYVYGVRNGRVSFVALAGRSVARRQRVLRSALSASGLL
jgi:hypothetical protein